MAPALKPEILCDFFQILYSGRSVTKNCFFTVDKKKVWPWPGKQRIFSGTGTDFDASCTEKSIYEEISQIMRWRESLVLYNPIHILWCRRFMLRSYEREEQYKIGRLAFKEWPVHMSSLYTDFCVHWWNIITPTYPLIQPYQLIHAQNQIMIILFLHRSRKIHMKGQMYRTNGVIFFIDYCTALRDT